MVELFIFIVASVESVMPMVSLFCSRLSGHKGFWTDEGESFKISVIGIFLFCCLEGEGGGAELSTKPVTLI